MYTGVVASETHATLIQASLRLNIVKELILNPRDGYQNARYLKKSKSLSSKLDAEMSPFAQASAVWTAGTSPSPSPAAPSPAIAPPAMPSVPSRFGAMTAKGETPTLTPRRARPLPYNATKGENPRLTPRRAGTRD